eukprot:scaffold341603_cov18-Prasinocladus_malaysianus.AAC.1
MLSSGQSVSQPLSLARSNYEYSYSYKVSGKKYGFELVRAAAADYHAACTRVRTQTRTSTVVDSRAAHRSEF